MKKILVTFIIIAYNEEKSIGNCLNSILSLSNLDNYEIIVVNDGSVDGTSKVVGSFVKNNKNIKEIVLSPNQGRGAARDTGVKKAVGKYIAFVDADIILPKDWITICLENIKKYDAVGGIAVPDGDVNYIYGKFNLNPKVAKQSTIITGNNGLYDSKVFNKVSFNISSKDGEDFELNKKLQDVGVKLHTINNLIVDHKETKTFCQSLAWLFQSGVGASRIFHQFWKIRLPDILSLLFVVSILFSMLLSISHNLFYLLLLPLFLLTVSSVHIYTKFYLNLSLGSIFAIITNAILLLSYFCGRIFWYWLIANNEVK